MTASEWVGLFLVSTSAVVAAQVPLTREPRHRVTFENAQMRILDVNIPPGDTSLDHRHDFDIVTVSMTGGTEIRVRNTGQPWTTRAPRPLGDAAVAEYAGKPGSHKVENTGKRAYQLFAVENLKSSGWTTTPAATGLATKLMTEARSFRIYDVRLAQQTVADVTHTRGADGRGADRRQGHVRWSRHAREGQCARGRRVEAARSARPVGAHSARRHASRRAARHGRRTAPRDRNSLRVPPLPGVPA